MAQTMASNEIFLSQTADNRSQIWQNSSSAVVPPYSVHSQLYEPLIFFEFVSNGIFLLLVGVMGLVGNGISIFILSRPQMRSSLNVILIGLASFDVILLLTSILMFALPSLYKYTGWGHYYYWAVFPNITPYTYPIALIAQTGSVYFTFTVTVERYVAVCHPLRARSLCTYGRARLAVFVIGLFSIAYNLPRFWEVERVTKYNPVLNVTVYEVSPSALRSNPIYVSVYITWMYFIVMYILPFGALAILNSAIYRQVRKANQERTRLTNSQKREIGLATMLLCVVVVFFICNILALVNNILEAAGVFVDEMVRSSNLLVTVNSSVNFVIYCIFGEKFKRLFLKHFCRLGMERTLSVRTKSPESVREGSIISSTPWPEFRRSSTVCARLTTSFPPPGLLRAEKESSRMNDLCALSERRDHRLGNGTSFRLMRHPTSEYNRGRNVQAARSKVTGNSSRDPSEEKDMSLNIHFNDEVQ